MTETSTDTKPLFEPVKINSLTIPNRIMMSPMTRSFSPHGVPGPDVAAYYRRRAEGGVGLIVTEGVGIDEPAAIDDPAVPVIYGSQAQAGWRHVVDQVHAAGGLIFPQLWHQGGLRDPSIAKRPEIAGLRPSGYWGTPGVVSYPPDYLEAMKALTVPVSEEKIAELIAAYAQGAADARAIGFDGVEIHGAHGYLIDAFLWSDTNRRSDQWGGSIRARTRFAVEVVRAMRKSVGPRFPIMFRFSQHKQQDYKARLAQTPQELEQYLAPLAEAGVDLFDVSARNLHSPGFSESSLTLAGWTRLLTGRPAVAVGGSGLTPGAMPADIAGHMAKGEYDLVGVGRALLHDPNWAAKVRAGLPTEGFDPASRLVLT